MANLERREYELVYILNPDLDEPSILSLNERIAQIITTQDGEMTNTELWGKRTLAYPIQKRVEGHYVLHRFQMAPQGTNELDRVLRFNESVLRYLLLRSDEL
jgi:small subunit ribosomal protein S6